MAEIIKTQAILLHEIQYSDSSKIGYFLTPHHGIIHLLAKGARKPKSKLGPHLIPFTLSEVIYSHKSTREIQTLQDITLIDSFKTARSHPSFFTMFSVFAEFLLKVIQEEEEIAVFFQHILNVLQWLNCKPDYLPNAAVNLMMAVPTQLGFKLSLKTCHYCKREETEKNGYIHIENGHWLCSACHSKVSGQKIKTTPSLRKSILNVVPARRLYQFTEIINPQILPDLAYVIQAYLSYHLHKRINIQSVEVLKEWLRIM